MEIEQWLVEYGGVEKGFFKRNFFTTLAQYNLVEKAKYQKKLNDVDMYRSLFLYESSDKDSRCMAPLVFDLDKDIDSEDEFKKVIKDTMLVYTYLTDELFIDGRMIQIYFSGSKGFHVEVPFECTGLDPDSDLAAHYKIIAQRINRETIYKSVDLKIYERRRLFREKNTINSKTGLYKVPISRSDLSYATYETIKEYANEPKELPQEALITNEKTKKKLKEILLSNKMAILKKRHPKTIVSLEKKPLLPCVEKLLSTGTGVGGRNNTCIAIASSLAQAGIEEQEAVDLCLSWNTHNEPPLPEYEIIRTVKSGFSMAHDGRGYGCAFFKENDYCIGDTCKPY